MENSFEEMYSFLLELKQVQKKLLDLSYNKRNAAYENNIEKLNEIVVQEMKYLSELKSLDGKREKLQKKLSGLMMIPESEITVSTLINRAGRSMKERFTIIQKELNGMQMAQKEINAQNKELLETQLDYTNAMLNIIVDSEDPLNNYYDEEGKASDKKNKKSIGLFDQQV